MFKFTLTVPLSSLDGVTIDWEYEAAYNYPTVAVPDTSQMSLMFEGTVYSDWDYEADDMEKVRPASSYTKLKNPRLLIEDYEQ